jgi:hypothetical protein
LERSTHGDADPNVLFRWDLFPIDEPVVLDLAWSQMQWAMIGGVSVLFGLAVAALWIKGLRKTTRPNREVGYLREETQIDPNKVAEFKPTWRSAR